MRDLPKNSRAKHDFHAHFWRFFSVFSRAYFVFTGKNRKIFSRYKLPFTPKKKKHCTKQLKFSWVCKNCAKEPVIPTMCHWSPASQNLHNERKARFVVVSYCTLSRLKIFQFSSNITTKFTSEYQISGWKIRFLRLDP